jgi:hypothetical protein
VKNKKRITWGLKELVPEFNNNIVADIVDLHLHLENIDSFEWNDFLKFLLRFDWFKDDYYQNQKMARVCQLLSL